MKITNLRTNLLLTAALLALAVATPVTADSQGWGLDPSHTEINFSVKHFFTPVSGSFREFDVDLRYDAEHPERSTVEVRIPVSSVYTGNSMRDNHLRSADWFEADKYPYITFKSTSVRKNGKDGLIARGPLTIKGVSHEIELPITLLGKQLILERMKKMLGGTHEVASFEASMAVDRTDFGVGVGSWATSMVVGAKVGIEILAEAHRR